MVTELDRDNFEDEISEAELCLVTFYTDWCRNCKRLEEAWHELAILYKDRAEVMVGRVDCTAADNMNRLLCEREKVSGVPSIRLYRAGRGEEYSGSRELEQLQIAVEAILNPTPEE